MKTKTIERYNKMIAWAKTQDLKKWVNPDHMLAEIGTDWFSRDCLYCKKYREACYGGERRCPLMSFSENFCCGGLWNEMGNTVTWGEWIEAAEKVKEYIKING